MTPPGAGPWHGRDPTEIKSRSHGRSELGKIYFRRTATWTRNCQTSVPFRVVSRGLESDHRLQLSTGTEPRILVYFFT
jgi:hypothetical protein